MFSIIASTLKVAGRLYALATACKKGRRNSNVKVRNENSLVIVRAKAPNKNSLTNFQDEIASTSTGGGSAPDAKEAGASSATTKVQDESVTAPAGATAIAMRKTTTTRMPTPTTTNEKDGDRDPNENTDKCSDNDKENDNDKVNDNDRYDYNDNNNDGDNETSDCAEQHCKGRSVKVQSESRLAIERAKALNENSLTNFRDEIVSTSTGANSVPDARETDKSSCSTTAQ